MKGLFYVLLISPLLSYTQVRWDGEGLDGRWDNPANWQPDGIPPPGAAVLLDNSLLAGNYTITLPAGNATIELTSLHIAPAAGTAVVLILPRENTASPGLRITGADESLVLERGAVLRNASGATAGETLQVLGSFRIANEGHYIHQTPRGNAALIDRLSTSPGTETGIFEFDVPGTAGYTVSLTGNIFGTLAFGAAAAGGIKSYSGSGASVLRIRGNWIIRPGATLTTTLNANIVLDGSLLIDGTLQLQPSTSGTSGRSILCRSPDGQIGGTGTLALQANFRDIVIESGAQYSLGRSIVLPFAQNSVRVLGGASLQMDSYVISGAGRFSLDAAGSLSIGHPGGIPAAGQDGQVTTAFREFHPRAIYRYTGTSNQVTGDGLPSEMATLVVDKPAGDLRLSGNVTITDTFNLQRGIVRSSPSAIPVLRNAILVSPPNLYGNRDEGWENSFVDGPVQYASEGPGSQAIPVGKSGVFAPMRITRETEGVAAYTVEYHPQAFGSLQPVNAAVLRKVSSLEYWSVSASGPASAIPARIALSWRPSSEVGAGDAAKSELRVAQYEDRGGGWQWEALGEVPQWRESNGYGWLESDRQAVSFQAFTLGSSGVLNPLPLRRLSLHAETRESVVYLRCLPEGDGDCPPLQLEKSSDGQYFTSLGIPSPGDACGREVRWTDSAPSGPLTYYRVREAGREKGISSPIVRVEAPASAKPALFPNPATNLLVIQVPGIRSGTPASIVQMDGRRVRHIFLQGEIHREDISTLPPGRYYLMVKHPDGRVMLPFLKQ
jgi:hypothetical protein